MVAGINTPTWFAVQTRYRSEQKVYSGLVQKGFSAYLPQLEEEHIWKDRRRKMTIPAFGGYLFVRMDLSLENRVRVLETDNVVRLLGNSREPVAVSEDEINALQAALAREANFSVHPYPLIAGCHVRVTRGPLAGITGTLSQFKNCSRLVLSVSMISQSIAAEVSIQDVEHLHPAAAVA